MMLKRTALFLTVLFLTSLGDACVYNGAWLSDLQTQHDLQSADLVATARVVSRSRSSHGSYSATFLLEKVIKNRLSKDPTEKFVRLRLKTRKMNNERFRSQSCGHNKVKPTSKYLLILRKNNQDPFAMNIDGYSIMNYPIRFKKKHLDQLKSILCNNCVIGKMKNQERRRREKLSKRPGEGTRLSCSARGNPPPTLYWTLNGKVVQNSESTKIITKDISKFLKKTVLKLKPSISNGSVKLQCHAFNDFGHASQVKMKDTIKTKTKHRITSKIKGLRNNLGKPSTSFGRLQYTHLADATSERRKSLFFEGNSPHVAGPLRSSNCPIREFCLNGGSCQYYSAIGEQICHCSRGYHGQRCELKYANTGSKGAAMSDRFPLCLLGMAHYPCS